MTAAMRQGTGWAPSVEQRTDWVDASSAAALHDLLDAPGPAPADGAPLPPLWHWLAFLPRAAQANLAPDGHPRTGAFLPPMPGRRRMFAGGRIDLGVPLHVGQPLARTSSVTEVTDKQGGTGPLAFVTVQHLLDPAGSDVPGQVREINDIVYREPPSGGTRGAPTRAAASSSGAHDPSWAWHRDVAIDPTLLFRFSALTYNAHRIHYDRTYATDVEGYPGLVVHGPLQAVLLAELVRVHLPERCVTRFEFRSRAAAFDDGPLLLRGRHDTATATLTAYDHRGTPTMTATAAFEELHP
ncbi:FAS1-like dehydratase domain-containing protein [Streptomyces sp. NPDC001312]|uniref:FAS1-like dehydratase domain-containing protein n=1 Tax=Streptomyces sp. NPDC001312 TaxID=3364561 RepID=UPI0036A4A00F